MTTDTKPETKPEDWRDWIARSVVILGMCVAATVGSAVVVAWLVFTVRLCVKAAKRAWLWSLLLAVVSCGVEGVRVQAESPVPNGATVVLIAEPTPFCKMYRISDGGLKNLWFVDCGSHGVALAAGQ